MSKYKVHSIEIAGIKRDLRLFEIKPGLWIAILNILGDTELVQACARELGKKLKVPVYSFLKDAIIRKYGVEFYETLEATAKHIEQSTIKK